MIAFRFFVLGSCGKELYSTDYGSDLPAVWSEEPPRPSGEHFISTCINLCCVVCSHTCALIYLYICHRNVHPSRIRSACPKSHRPTRTRDEHKRKGIIIFFKIFMHFVRTVLQTKRVLNTFNMVILGIET